MLRKSFFWRLTVSYLVVAMVSLLAIAWFTLYTLRHYSLVQVKSGLEARAKIVEGQFKELLLANKQQEIDRLCKELGAKSLTRITVVNTAGLVLGDSHRDPKRMDNHGQRPEIVLAYKEGVGRSQRYSNTLAENMIYVALAVSKKDRLLGIVRTSVSLNSVNILLNDVAYKVTLAGIVIAILLFGIGIIYARMISRPLEEIRQGAERFAKGNLTETMKIYKLDEVGEVAKSMNDMATQLNERISTVVRQRNERQAILSSMVEGVLAVDTEEKILEINRAAAGLFNVQAEVVRQRSIKDTIANNELRQFISATLQRREKTEGEIILLGEEHPRFLQLHGGLLRDGEGNSLGVLIVINDVTRLYQLENVRREFVANVSHELRTPLTSIKGFVETLIDGAVNDKEEAKKFLQIIARQVERLNSIIEDLLQLSRLEREQEKQGIALAEREVKEIIDLALDQCLSKIEEKRIKISKNFAKNIKAMINAPLLEHALVNLLDNALKFSEEGTEIKINCIKREGEIVISVIDQGPGIEREHLPRIFERFYRVDKARSRKQGGTGLGLAIVKHIAEVHAGRVTVESKAGVGSTFKIHLPIV